MADDKNTPLISVPPGVAARLSNMMLVSDSPAISVAKDGIVDMDNVHAITVGKPNNLDEAHQFKSQSGWAGKSFGKYDARADATITERCEGTNPFNDPKTLLTKARKHFDNLQIEVANFFDGPPKPYSLIIDDDLDRGQQVHKIRLDQNIPLLTCSTAKDSITNIHDALDHAITASNIALGRIGGKDRIMFPFGCDGSDLHGKLNSAYISIHPEIRSLIEFFRPHKGGDQLLWGLNCIRNVDVHRIIVPLVCATIGNRMRIDGTIAGEALIGQERWCPPASEAEFLSVGIGSLNINYQLDISTQVLIGDAEVWGGKPAFEIIGEAISMAESIVLGIESETGRIIRAIF